MMRITDVESIVLQYDMDEPLGYSQGYYHQRTAHLVRIHTDEGLCGIGEIFGAGNFAFANQGIVRHVLSPLLMGRNPLDINAIWHDLYNHLRDHGQKGMPIASISGLDIALWDILGKSTGLPLYQLLGGKCRDDYIAYGYGMMFQQRDDLEDSYGDEAQRIVEMGFTALKMKIGMGIARDTSLATAVKQAAGNDIKLMADANHAYTPGEAISIGNALRELGFYWFEEPIMPEDYQGYRTVRQALGGLQIAAGEAEWTRFGHRELLTRECVDILQPEVAATGGISEFMKILSMAHAFGTPVIPHVWGSDVLIAVDMHLLAVIPDLPGGLHQFEPMLEYDTTPNLFHSQLLAEPLNILAQVSANGGRVRPPEKPGIGVELDEEFIAHHRVA
ncbi:MAG: mandelate racemase/muconate lactonizing enzyme family protein [Planctomycetota bacterium]|nr:mandelate racemase/muconate lactonizing enzyme family protein [Planctomycetota bacterium]